MSARQTVDYLDSTLTQFEVFFNIFCGRDETAEESSIKKGSERIPTLSK